MEMEMEMKMEMEREREREREEGEQRTKRERGGGERTCAETARPGRSAGAGASDAASVLPSGSSATCEGAALNDGGRNGQGPETGAARNPHTTDKAAFNAGGQNPAHVHRAGGGRQAAGGPRPTRQRGRARSAAPAREGGSECTVGTRVGATGGRGEEGGGFGGASRCGGRSAACGTRCGSATATK